MAGMSNMKFGMTRLASNTDVEILFPYDMTKTSNEVSEVFQTEAGTDEIILTRKDKQSINMVFHCSSAWVRKFKQFYNQGSFYFEEYDSVNGTERRHVRMTGYSEKLIKNSWKVDTSITTGLWEVTFTLEEL